MNKFIFSSTNIHSRFREAINTLCEADGDLQSFRETFTEQEWHKFVSHMSGWVVSSLMNSEEKMNNRDGI